MEDIELVLTDMYESKQCLIRVELDLLKEENSTAYMYKDGVWLHLDYGKPSRLEMVGVLEEVENTPIESKGVVSIYYCLTKTFISKVDHIREHFGLTIQNTDNLTFLDLSYLATLLSHVGKGVVKFEYNGVMHTARTTIAYDYFETQSSINIKIDELPLTEHPLLKNKSRQK